MATENEELVLLERVFLRIGSADTDEQFEAAVGKFLAPILLKLSSQVEGVRKKVMELLVHVNKRLKSRSKIQLPMDDLFQQYLNADVAAFVTNFTVLYLKMGFPRLEFIKQAELVPQLLKCLDGKPEAQQISFCQLLMPALPHVQMPSKSDERVEKFGLKDQRKVRNLVLGHMLDYLLLPYNFAVYQERTRSAQVPSTTQPNQTPNPSGASTPAEPAFNGPPPAMSEAAFKAVIGENPPTPEDLEKIKHGIIQFLSGDMYPKEEILVHLLIATADTRYSVATAADRELKKIVDNDDWNSPTIISKLYAVFQGTVAVKGKPLNMKPDQKRTPASVQIRLKMFPYLLKSKEAANKFPACVQIVFDCLYGANTNHKLKNMAVQFIHHLCLNCSEATFRPMGAVLLSGMVKLVGESKEDSKLRMLSYIAVGKIAKRVPLLVTRDMTLLQNFFDAISKEAGENRLAVQEALSMMSQAFKNVDPANAKLVEALIMQNIDKEEPQARQMAVEYAKAVFPSDHVPSRYVLLLACGDSKDEIRSEAIKALRAPLFQDEETSLIMSPKEEQEKTKPLPPFIDMLNYIQDKGALRVKSQHKYIIGNNILPFNPPGFIQVLTLLRRCLAHDAGLDPGVDSIMEMQAQAPGISSHMKKIMDGETGVEKTILNPYIQIIRQLLSAYGDELPMYLLLEAVAILKEQMAPVFVSHLDWIKNMMFSTKDNLRSSAAELYATVVVTAFPPKQLNDTVNELYLNLKSQALEGQHGSLLCLGHIVGKYYANLRSQTSQITIEDMETDQNDVDQEITKTIDKVVKAIVELLDNSQTMLSLGACIALGEIGRFGTLPLSYGSEESTEKITTLSAIKTLLKKVKSDKENAKIREEAAVCLGYLCVGDENFPHTEKVISGLLDSAAAKQFDLHFTIGDALVCCALGVKSPEGRDKWTQYEKDYIPSASTKDQVNNLLKQLLTKYSRNPNPHIRQAACIWLVSVTKKCRSHSTVQQQLKQIQQAFMGMLSENDELTQDLASKGLGVVYEVCGADQKQELVSMLVEALTTGRRKAVEVSSDTQVFEEGALGKTPDGKGMTTYKELCSIANDLNQPDLIYKFMHLANHNAVWNSKKGAAFGFTTIAAQAGEQLAPYLHKIIPKLYRYQFDPNAKIQLAMSSIWSSLVTKPKETIDKYLPEILADLENNLTSNQWRTRESSCMAVNDLLRGRSLDEVVDALPALWDKLFRVRDDIKESVRNAADMAVKTLSRASIKICDPNYGKVGDKATALVLPVLLKSGLGSSVKEVQQISLTTLIKISKSAGILLKPHIPMLCVALLESLSTLEPQYLNYVSLHLASSEASLEKLDNARIAATKSSPMMDTVNLCVQYVDGEVMAELIPRLLDLSKSSVGLGTKAGCANLLISMSHQCPQELVPYAGKILGVLLHGLTDRNTTVKKSNASVIGHLVKIAKDSSVEKLIQRLKQWYLEKEDESVRQACGSALQAINRYAPDILRRHGAEALPLAFLAMHQDANKQDSDKESQSVWEEVWLDATPGTEGGIRLYLTELVGLSQHALQSQSWSMKAQGAATMASMADKLKANLRSPHLGLVLKTLLDGLTGRTWTGKESLLKAIGVVCTSCKDALLVQTEGQPTIEEVLVLLMKECKKENLKYKAEAIVCTTDILEAYELDRFKDISDILYPVLQKDRADVDKDDTENNVWCDFQESSYHSLGKAWPTEQHLMTQHENQESFTCLMCKALNNSVWKVELAALKALLKFVKRCSSLKSLESLEQNRQFISNLCASLIPQLSPCLGKVKYVSIRTTSLELVEVLLTNCDTGDGVWKLLTEESRNQITTALRSMWEKDSQTELQDKASTLVKTLDLIQ